MPGTAYCLSGIAYFLCPFPLSPLPHSFSLSLLHCTHFPYQYVVSLDYCLFPIAYQALLPTVGPIDSSISPPPKSSPFFPIPFCLLPTAYGPLPIAYCVLLSTYCPFPLSPSPSALLPCGRAARRRRSTEGRTGLTSQTSWRTSASPRTVSAPRRLRYRLRTRR